MNLFNRNSHKQVLGIFVDGRDLRLAHLGYEHGEIVIHALEAITLQHRMGKISTVKSPSAVSHDSEGKDVFGFEDMAASPESISEEEESGGDVSSALINIFSKYPLAKTHLAVNSPEGQTTYYSFEDNFKLKGKKLEKRLREEIGPLAGGSVESSLLDHFISPTGELTAVVFEGTIPLIEELLEIKSFLQGGAPYFALVQSNELALVNLARVALNLPDTGHSALVYIGADFSRVIILKGEYPLSFVQPIHEGYTSPQVCQTIFSKILLEQEEAGLPEIENIILGGEVGMTYAFEFFSKQFPDAKVQSFTPGPLNVNELKPEEIAVFPNYAIPVALAWQALDHKNARFIPTDLLPPAIKESQKYFKIAWHGIAMLGFVFCAISLLSYQGLKQKQDIKTLQTSIRQKQETIESLQPELAVLNQIQLQIGNYRTNLEFLDSLIVDPGKWSRLFAKLTENFHAVSDIWIEDIKSDPQGFTMIGKALERDRIPKMAVGFDGAKLIRVTRAKAEDGELTYEFEMTANVPAPKIQETLIDSALAGDHALNQSGAVTTSSSASTVVPEPAATTSETATPAQAEIKPPESKAIEPIQPKQEPPSPAQVIAEPTPPKVEPEKVIHVPEPTAKKSVEAAPVVAQPVSEPVAKLPQKPSAFSQTYNQGIQLVRTGDSQGAIKTFQEVIAANPAVSEAAAAHYWLGECHFANGDYESATADFQASLGYNVSTKHEAAMLMLGMAYLKLQQLDQARSWFENLLEQYPAGEYASSAETNLKRLNRIAK